MNININPYCTKAEQSKPHILDTYQGRSWQRNLQFAQDTKKYCNIILSERLIENQKLIHYLQRIYSYAKVPNSYYRFDYKEIFPKLIEYIGNEDPIILRLAINIYNQIQYRGFLQKSYQITQIPKYLPDKLTALTKTKSRTAVSWLLAYIRIQSREEAELILANNQLLTNLLFLHQVYDYILKQQIIHFFYYLALQGPPQKIAEIYFNLNIPVYFVLAINRDQEPVDYRTYQMLQRFCYVMGVIQKNKKTTAVRSNEQQLAQVQPAIMNMLKNYGRHIFRRNIHRLLYGY